VSLSSLSSVLAKSLCRYQYQSEQKKFVESAYRKIESQVSVFDLSQYDNLRLGVALDDGNSLLGAELLATSGVLVKNGRNDEFITVVFHEFSYRETVSSR
jgi:hypothetical protein